MNMKQLPSSLDAEINILSSIFYNPKKILKVINELSSEDFYFSKNKIIYDALIKLFSEDKPIELIRVIEAIGKERLVEVGGVTYITSVIEAGFSGINIEYNIKLLKDKSKRRKLIKLISNVSEKAYDSKEDLSNLVRSLQNFIIDTNTNSKILNDAELLSKTLNEIEARYNAGGNIPGMVTGFNSFDAATNGLKRGEVTIIAGRPSMGKTLIALHLADGLSNNGYKVGLFEMEMTEEALGMRRIGYSSFIDAYKIQKGKLSDKEWEKISYAYSKLSSRNNIFTDCSPDNSILDIKAKAKLLKQQYGLDVIIIDHLTLLRISNKERRDVAVGEITRQCKLMAKELDINVIVLSQLNRANEMRADKRPMLSDLRESGSIEQDADLVIFAHREEYYNRETEDKNIMEWIIAKQRNGKTGILKFHYNDAYQMISELDYIRK